jgi:FkbM family methyltransferase
MQDQGVAMNLLQRLSLRLRFGLWAPLRAGRHPSFHFSHSQFGEDMLARALLANVDRGVYVDIGAHHPVYYSNTYYFYRHGWRGLNVDAAPGTKALFDLLRGRDINVEACVADQANRAVVYFCFNQSALNTTDPATAEAHLKRPGVQLLERRTMTTVTLDSLLQRHLPGTKIDLLSIDVEGMDELILASHDWNRWRPTVVIVERHGAELTDLASDGLVQRLCGMGYRLQGKCGPSMVFGS